MYNTTLHPSLRQVTLHLSRLEPTINLAVDRQRISAFRLLLPVVLLDSSLVTLLSHQRRPTHKSGHRLLHKKEQVYPYVISSKYFSMKHHHMDT
jgi:hypothetical protein